MDPFEMEKVNPEMLYSANRRIYEMIDLKKRKANSKRNTKM